jgi:predicted N-acetyltransferase YhbS
MSHHTVLHNRGWQCRQCRTYKYCVRGAIMSRNSEQTSKLLAALVVRPASVDDLAAARTLIAAALQRTLGIPTAGSSDDVAAVQTFLSSTRFVDTLRGSALTMAWLDGVPVAVGGWVPLSDSGKVARLGSVAVAPMFGGLGIGRFIVGQIEASARRAGFRDLVVHASAVTADFYRGLGYATNKHGAASRTDGKPRPTTALRKSLVAPVVSPDPDPAANSEPGRRRRLDRTAAMTADGRSDVRPRDKVLTPMPSKATH